MLLYKKLELTERGEKMDCENQVSQNIKTLIKIKGYKQKAIAEKSGFTQQEFSDMVNNRKLIKADYVPKIAKALEVTPNDLFQIKKRKEQP